MVEEVRVYSTSVLILVEDAVSEGDCRACSQKRDTERGELQRRASSRVGREEGDDLGSESGLRSEEFTNTLIVLQIRCTASLENVF